MLDVAFSELLVIALVALVVVGPKDMPYVIRRMVRTVRDLRAMLNGLKQQVTSALDIPALEEPLRGVTTILDLEGKPQPAYDVRELEALKQPPAACAPSPDAS